jgi:hypothetical protein
LSRAIAAGRRPKNSAITTKPEFTSTSLDQKGAPMKMRVAKHLGDEIAISVGDKPHTYSVTDGTLTAKPEHVDHLLMIDGIEAQAETRPERKS